MENHHDESDRVLTALGEMSTRHGEIWTRHLQWVRQQPPILRPVVEERVQAWRLAVGGEEALRARWSADRLTEGRAWAAVSGYVPLATEVPEWFKWFEDVRIACLPWDSAKSSAPPGGDDLAWLTEREESMPPAARSLAFGHVWWPAVEAAIARVQRDHPAQTAGCTPTALRDLAVGLLARLTEVSASALLADMTADLTIGQRLVRRLDDAPADAPRIEFARYCRRLADGGLDDVLLDYPVLPSLIGTAIRQWHAATVEMLTRIDRHRAELADLMGIDPGLDLTGVEANAGDRHQDGRSVAVLTFGAAAVVYKPRDVRLEDLWTRVVEAVSDQLPGSRLRAPRVLAADDGSAYGFSEFIAHVPAQSAHQEEMFYRDAGRTLALLHALSATDCHHENLIAHGGHLVLIDAEALFETRMALEQDGEPGVGAGRATVLQVGMLPSWLWLEGERMALDISALGCTPTSVRRGLAQGWRAVNTDAMSRGPVSVPPPRLSSLPTPPHASSRLPEHVETLVDGFREGYRALMSVRDTRLPPLLDEAASFSRRLIVRPTYVYAVLLAQSREPDALRSLIDRGMVMERLAQAHVGEPTWPLLAAEQEALARLDIPLFEDSLTGDGTHWLGGAMTAWPGTNALAEVRTRIGNFDEDDLAWQVRLIRSSIAARQFSPVAAEPEPEPVAPSAVDEPHEVGRRVLDQVVEAATTTGSDVTWMTLVMLPDGDRVNVQRVGTGLYDGALGIALYLTHIGQRDLADAALAPLLNELASAQPTRIRRQLLAVGPGWSGAGGYLRALRALERTGLLDAARTRPCITSVLDAVPSVGPNSWLDFMNGVAGLIPPLAAELERRDWSDADRARMRSWIASAADLLVTRQREDGGWTTLPGSAPLTGLAHGASGIALALAEAAHAVGEPRYLDAALRGIAYEASTFEPQAGNWPDFREAAGGGFMLGWCAGAPGIGLVRMRLLQLLPDHADAETWLSELVGAATITAAAPLLQRDHVCCGNLGRAAVLRTMATASGHRDWADDADRLVHAVARRASGGLPRSFLGRPAHGILPVPGLMTGLAGCGLMLDGPSGADVLSGLLL